MPEFRILKTQKTNGLGESQVEYKIQKRFLFWFFDYGIKTHYYTYNDPNGHHFNRPNRIAFLIKRIFAFDDEEMARQYLEKIKTPFKERYKGDLIGLVFDDNTGEDVYINYSHSGYFNGSSGYEFSRSLEDLKKMIDRRKFKLIKQVV